MHIARFLFVFALIACGSVDDGSTDSDGVNSSESNDNGATLNTGVNPDVACTGAVYDPCASNSQCMSGMCHLYSGAGFQVCTQACSATMPCPNDSSGATIACNQMGNCKPTVPNNCTR